jgi:hypothetical protein
MTEFLTYFAASLLANLLVLGVRIAADKYRQSVVHKEFKSRQVITWKKP